MSATKAVCITLTLLGMCAGSTSAQSLSVEPATPGFLSSCFQVANLARSACVSDATDDYLTFLGNCAYINDGEQAEECREEALEEYAEELGMCRERTKARRQVCKLLDEDKYDPEIDPQNFMSPDEIAANPNPYFPLAPGNTWVYENEEETITVVVLEETIEIEDIECVVVRDTVVLGETGELIEDTYDWYSQDLDGNVWYMGEIARNYEDGMLVDLEGSWRSGEDFAKAGTLIPLVPYPGQAYRQEYYLREAEDMAKVLQVDASASTETAVCERSCLKTEEWSPIEPGVVEYKYYLPGVGLILEYDPESGERTELVSYNLEDNE